VSAPLLRVEGLSKRYPPTAQPRERLKAFWQILWRNRAEGGIDVLTDISFEVRPGESLAVIGSNGAGKSTLLKLISGVLAPTAGRVGRNGTSAALLELGAGFDLEYTGLDNLRMNAALLGLSRRQIDERLDDILAFADIGASIDEPVKHYSSGMVVRLGFAVVASVRPDLLITDEVLAVGDESFQKKCIRWIEGYLDRGGTLLMVSHNMYQVQKLCRHAIWLDGGRARATGDVFDVTQSYLAWHERKDARQQTRQTRATVRAPYRVDRLLVNGASDTEVVLEHGDGLRIHLELVSPEGRPPAALIGLVRADGTPVYGVATDHDDVVPEPLADDRFAIVLDFPRLPLLPGGYAVRAHALDPEGLRLHDTVERPFTVRGRSRELGLVRIEHNWRSP